MFVPPLLLHPPPRPATFLPRFLAGSDSDSDSDDDRRVVLKSARDKRFSELSDTCDEIRVRAVGGGASNSSSSSSTGVITAAAAAVGCTHAGCSGSSTRCDRERGACVQCIASAAAPAAAAE